MSSTDVGIEDLYHNYSSWLKNYLYRRLGSQSDAADIAHDAFIKLMLRRDSTSQYNRAYLCSVAKSLCVDLWRRRRIEQAWLEELASRPDLAAPSEEERFLLIEALVLIDSMLDTLPSTVRTTFIMSQLEGATYAEIAKKLAVSERSIKRYMAKAMLECTLVRLELESAGRL